MINLVAVAVGIYAVLVGGLFLAQRQLIYYPSQTLASPAEAGIPEMQVLRVTTDDGLGLTFWYRPADKGQPTLVYFHGNGGNLSGRGFKVRSYLNAGYGVLLAAYRGYGGNPGKPSEAGLYSDARAQLKFLESQDVAPRDWVLYGESLGSGVAVHMAFEQAGAGGQDEKPAPVGAVVLEAPFSSLGDAAQAHYPYVPARLMIRDRFDSLAKIDRINAPVFIFQGELDGVISPIQGKRLFEAALEPKQAKWVAGAGHNNLYDFGVGDMVIDFVSKSHGVGR
ncbi:MAG TPA: alpha/beta hydrolase [Sneathiellales bacterium]|nr:alpha/beta hydrolase [Sneathiellales bacterium]